MSTPGSDDQAAAEPAYGTPPPDDQPPPDTQDEVACTHTASVDTVLTRHLVMTFDSQVLEVFGRTKNPDDTSSSTRYHVDNM
ncbi:MAG: hypothetical protein FWD11_11560 [Micrococcales bacterium]|nr:hypothetical protein [Micrococcales bacterium]